MADLEKLFDDTVKRPPGSCPLPEPGTGQLIIQHVDHMGVSRQPCGYDYDLFQNNSEEIRFRKQVAEMVLSGQVTQEEANKLMTQISEV